MNYFDAIVFLSSNRIGWYVFFYFKNIFEIYPHFSQPAISSRSQAGMLGNFRAFPKPPAWGTLGIRSRFETLCLGCSERFSSVPQTFPERPLGKSRAVPKPPMTRQRYETPGPERTVPKRSPNVPQAIGRKIPGRPQTANDLSTL